ncbi:unnamed protein product [Didymodactylos carnosus]|uniref:Myb/SANT-like DNA-binding domain-containing protein n=1 Tax=Didymodactylos carnosus TaxID=1234261 RepID=A0A813QQV4_9BILA|nr:unnamed protein product [Didymodactylos carnosus]CAF1143987.1 unnamed protein product [Didymodactylos carnosus]CAF3552013.1 unnamed protein product [Didymodactylos carnosus]CAF3943534.1 unnamed protein product [Didymodactylos carnosus]
MPRGISWSYNETDALIQIWADENTQHALKSNSRNRCVYEDIAKRLQILGINRNADQCQMRIKLLKKLYRQAKETINRGDRSQRPCPFYDEIDMILGHTSFTDDNMVNYECEQNYENEDDDEQQVENNNYYSIIKENDSDDDPKMKKNYSETKENDNTSGYEPSFEQHEDEEDNKSNHRLISSPPPPPLHMNNKSKSTLNTIKFSSCYNDSLTLAIEKLIDYKNKSESRWYQFLKDQSELEKKRREQDRQYQLQVLQLLIRATTIQQQNNQYQPQQSFPLTAFQQLLSSLDPTSIAAVISTVSTHQQQQQQKHNKRPLSSSPVDLSENKVKKLHFSIERESITSNNGENSSHSHDDID